MDLIKRLFIRTFAGAFLGISVFAPGISGSVVAIAMGVYHDIVRIASSPFKPFKQNMIFLAPIAIGMGVSAVLLVVLFPDLFAAYQRTAFMLFTGLIAGNLPMIFAEVKPHKFRASHGVSGVLAFAIAVGVMVLSMFVGDPGATGVTSGWWMFLIGGLVAGMLTLVPGMSIATLLIVMGIYPQVMYAANQLFGASAIYLPHLLLFIGGIVAGLVLVAKSIAKSFDKWPGPSHSSVFGFMIGSMVGMALLGLTTEHPFAIAAGWNWLIDFVAILVGVGISIGFMVMGKKMNSTAK
ncbi:MAG: DUF368 domain-containing protein [Oscillospiraceae bacterium]|nr:DUF368 domain-containing protein [Oscillospiraceae bacterium]